MWCPQCQADVAAELSADHSRLRCVTCATELGQRTEAVPSDEKTRDARELLHRWSSSSLFDPYGPVLTSPEPGGPTPGISLETPPATEPPRPRTAPASPSSPQPKPPQGRKTVAPVRRVRLHQAQASRPPAPHIDIPAAVASESSRRGTNWVNLMGQFCAYGGVGLLTCGSALVLWGYFGGPAQYAPTGWLMTTAGQMLLFLGVVTLVSSGLEQTSDDVNRKIDALGERLLRLEVAVRENLSRSHAALYEDADDGDEEPGQSEAA